MRGYIERIAVERKEFEAFDQRVKALQTSVVEAEKGMEGLAARDRLATAVGQRVDQLSKQMQTLNTQADDLMRKQTALDSLQESLGQVDELAKKTAWQYENLKQSRQDLDTLRKEIQDFYKSHAAAVQLRDRLATDRSALEGFLERTTVFSTGLPELEARMDAITGKLAIVDEGTQKAANLVSIADDLDRQMTRIATQQQFVERVEATAQHAELADLRGRQEARRADLTPRRGRSAPQPGGRRRHRGDRRAAEAGSGERDPEQAAAADDAALDAQEPDREGARAVRRGAEGRGRARRAGEAPVGAAGRRRGPRRARRASA